MIMNAYLDSVKIRNRKIQGFINLTILFYEKTMRKVLQDNIINEQEQRELKDIYINTISIKKMIIKNQLNLMLKKYSKILQEKSLKEI